MLTALGMAIGAALSKEAEIRNPYEFGEHHEQTPEPISDAENKLAWDLMHKAMKKLARK
jgi:hypothetical protein